MTIFYLITSWMLHKSKSEGARQLVSSSRKSLFLWLNVSFFSSIESSLCARPSIRTTLYQKLKSYNHSRQNRKKPKDKIEILKYNSYSSRLTFKVVKIGRRTFKWRTMSFLLFLSFHRVVCFEDSLNHLHGDLLFLRFLFKFQKWIDTENQDRQQ